MINSDNYDFSGRSTWSGSGALVAARAEDSGVFGARRNKHEFCSKNTHKNDVRF
jgi:hypothetical protein